MQTDFDRQGFGIIEGLLTASEIEQMLAALSGQKIQPLRGGIRRINALVPQVAELAISSRLLALAQTCLPGEPRLVRAIYFDKSPESNWYVTWHQDRTVAVSKQFEATGWKPWTRKADAWHVQPPLDVLEAMITIRLHLDDATLANGCLRVVPASHKLGLLPTQLVAQHMRSAQIVDCEAAAGDALLMRPHILHASAKSDSLLPRRVLHFEYSSYALPQGITWAA